MKNRLPYFYFVILVLLLFFVELSLLSTAWAFRAPDEDIDQINPQGITKEPLLPITKEEPPDGFQQKMYMAPITLPTMRITDRYIEDAILYFLETQNFPLSPTELILKYSAEILNTNISKVSGGKVFVYEFVQKVDMGEKKYEVQVTDVKLIICVPKNGNQGTVLEYDTQVYPNISQSLPRYSPLDSKNLEELTRDEIGQPDAKLVQQKEFVGYYKDKGGWLWTTEFSFDIGSIKSELDVQKDPGNPDTINSDSIFSRPNVIRVNTNTGEVLEKINNLLPIYAHIGGEVKGRGNIFDPLSELSTLTLEDLQATTTTGSSTFTDAQGQFRFLNERGPATVNVTLRNRGFFGGNFVVNSATSQNLNFSGPATPGQSLSILFNPSGNNEDPIAQVNGDYHTEYIFKWAKRFVPSGWIMPPLTVNVNINSACNAYYNYDPMSINFFRSGSGCVNTAYDTVIYHEFGHYFDDRFGPIINEPQRIALSEGWGDIFASFATNQPLIGENFFGTGGHIRTANNNYQYPENGIDEVHNLGQAWAGFAWHLKERLISRYGQQQGSEIAESLLVGGVLLTNPRNIPDAVTKTIVLDDDDGNLGNGTPHLSEIIASAQQSNLYPLRDQNAVKITNNFGVLRSSQGTLTITGLANTPWGFPFQRYQLFYGVWSNPNQLTPIGQPVLTPVNGTLGTWDISNLPSGTYRLQLIVTAATNIQFQHTIQICIENNSPRRITPISAVAGFIDISGDRIVWQDYRYAPYVPRQNYFYDLTTNRERLVIDHTSGPIWEQYNPAISGSKVVFEAYSTYHSGLDYDIFFYDLATETGRAITYFDGINQWKPDISGNRIVWADCRNGSCPIIFASNLDIYLFDLTNNTERPICNAPGNQWDPKISGNLIVWSDGRNNNYDIYLYDLNTQTEHQIARNTAVQAKISGNRIVWSDNRNGDYDIYSCVYNPKTGACPEERITTNPKDQLMPAISGNLIVWRDYRNADGQYHINENYNSDIYLYNLNTQQEQQVTFHPAAQGYPEIDGNRVIWEDGRFNTFPIPGYVYRDVFMQEVQQN